MFVSNWFYNSFEMSLSTDFNLITSADKLIRRNIGDRLKYNISSIQ